MEEIDSILKRINSEIETIRIEEIKLQCDCFTNTIYSLGEKYILKICTSKNNEENFVRATNFCAKYENILKTPHIVYSDLSKNDIEFYYVLMEKVKGENLSNVWTELEQKKREDVIFKLTNKIKDIHMIDDDIFSNVLVETNAWAQKFYEDICNRLKALYDNKIVSQQFETDIFKFIENNICYLEESNYAICHADLHFDNIMLDENQEIVILDFDRLRKSSIDYELDVINRMCFNPNIILQHNNRKKYESMMFNNLMEMMAQFYPQLFDFEHLDKRLKVYGIKQYLNILSQKKNKRIVEEIIEFLNMSK